MLESLYPIVLPLHIITAFVLIGLVVLADKTGTAWLLGTVETVDAKTVDRYHRFINYGLMVSILTGAIMFYPYHEYLLSVPEFRIKLSFVAVLVVNGYVIGRFMETAKKQSFASLSKKQKVFFLISGAVSTTAWITVLIASYSLPI